MSAAPGPPRRAARTGRPAKRKFGPWVFTAFRLLAGGKRVRGSWVDPFGRNPERRAERRWRDEYVAMIERICGDLRADRLETAIALASLPADIRGFGPVKEAAMLDAEARRAKLLQDYATPASHPTLVAA